MCGSGKTAVLFSSSSQTSFSNHSHLSFRRRIMLKRVVGFTYVILCYLVFFGTFLCAIAFVGGGNLYAPEQKLVAPWAIDFSSRPLGESLAMRLIIDALLLSLF